MKKMLIAFTTVSALFLSFLTPAEAEMKTTNNEEPVLTEGNDLFKNDAEPGFITVQPESVEVNYPDGAEFHIEVKDPSQVESYQWYYSDGYSVFELDGSSASTDTLIVPSTMQDDPQGGYVCVVTTKDGKTALSDSVSLTVVNPEEDKTVLYVGAYGIEPGEELDLSSTELGSGTISFDANGADITFRDIQFDNTAAIYDHTVNPAISFFLVRRRSEVLEYKLHFYGECMILNTFFQKDYNAGGVAFNAFFGSGADSNHPTIIIDGDGQVTFKGGSNAFYTDGEVDLYADLKLESYGEYFSDGITCHNLYVEEGVTLGIDCHGTAIHTDGDLYLYKGSKVNIDTTPARVSVGPTAKDIIFLMGTLFAQGSEINIKAHGNKDWFVPYETYLMMLNGIAMNGSGYISLDASRINIEMTSDESDTPYAGNFSGIVGAEVNNSIDMTNESSINIRINTPGTPGATGIATTGLLNMEKASSITLDVTGAGETFGMEIDREITLNDSSIDVTAVSDTDEATYGVVCGGAEIKLSDQKYQFHSAAKGGVAFAADTGEILDEPEEFSGDYEAEKLILGGKAKIMTPKKGKAGLYAVPGYGSYIKAETILDGTAPASEVLITVKAPSMIPYFIGAILIGLALGFMKGQKK